MMKRDFIVKDEKKYGAILVTELVDSLAKFSSKIFLEYENDEYDAKSIINLMTLELEKGNKLTISAIGSDAQNALNIVEDILRKKEVI